jgi:predicted amidophosphoribosyltransferase
VLLKFEEMDPLADWFADRLAEAVRLASHELQADVVVPVPLHKDRHRERGFNQAELLSAAAPRRSAGQRAPEAGQTLANESRAKGSGSWRFCHTSWQPS